MYVEERVYRLKIGAVAEYCKNYEENGMKIQLKHLPHMVGYYFTEVGGLNTRPARLQRGGRRKRGPRDSVDTKFPPTHPVLSAD